MRLARQRAISRRKPFQIGFNITSGVFLSLAGLWVASWVLFLFFVFISSGQEALSLQTFLYGTPGTFGLWDAFAFIVAGLFFAQLFRAMKAHKQQQTKRTGIVLGVINMLMIALFAYFLAANWAFFNADKPGASQITSVSTVYPLSLFTSFEYVPNDESEAWSRYREEQGWVALDETSYIHEDIGVIVKSETVHRNYSERTTRPFLEARNIDPSFATDEYQYDYFYYDLDGRFIYTDAWMFYKHTQAKVRELEKNRSDVSAEELFERLNAWHHAKIRKTPFTYDEILQMVEASWDDVSLNTPDAEPPSSNQE